MKVEKIDHIHVYVKDLDKVVEFLSDLLGTKFTAPMDLREHNMRAAVDTLGLEVMESTSPDGVVAKTIERRGEGIAAISLKVPDIEEAIAHMQSRGLRLISRLGHGKLKEAHFHPKDSYGVMIELCEYDTDNALEALPEERREQLSK